MQHRIGRRVALFPLSLQGHLTPFIQLADILYSRGFSISIIHTYFNSPNPANHPHFTFHPIPDGLSQGDTLTKDVIALTNRLNVACKETLRDCLSQMLSDSSEEPLVCLITDAIWHFSQAIADSFKLPRMVLRTSGMSAFVVSCSLPLLQQKGYIPIEDVRFDELVPDLPPLKVKDIPRIQTHDTKAFYELLDGMVRETKASAGLIFNSFEELEISALDKINQEFTIPVFSIGPFHKRVPTSSSSLRAKDQSSIFWLNNQAPESVLYVSFGSLVSIDETEFQEIAWGLASCGQSFLWVVRPGLVRGSNGPDPYPDGFFDMVGTRGLIVKWAPQTEVLAHSSVGAFWTHNGWNSTLESICEGVPMICSPFFSDQLVNARYVTDVWNIGLGLENGLKRGEIEKAIRLLMMEKDGKEMRERSARLKENASFCLAEGGSSYISLERLASQILSVPLPN